MSASCPIFDLFHYLDHQFMRTLSFICLLFIASTALGQQQYFTLRNESGVLQTIPDLMQEYQVPGTAMLVLRDYQIDTLLLYGFRDRENKLPVTPNTLFQMGGISTTLLKFALLKAVERGEIDLDAPANSYLQSWKLPQKRWARKNPVTVRDLMIHRRGFAPISKPKGYAPGAPLPTLLQCLRGDAPSNMPGVRLRSSKNKSGNHAYYNALILQQLMEDVWGKPLDSIIQHEVLNPLGMTESTLRQVLNPEEKARAAVGYDRESQRIPGDYTVFAERAVGNLWSTPEDYAKFVLHLYRARDGVDNSMISQELALQCFVPQFGNASLIFYKGYDSFSGGASTGYRTEFQGKPETGFAVIALSNRWQAWRYNSKITGMAWEYGRRFQKK